MRNLAKLAFLFVFLLSVTITAFAQESDPSKPPEPADKPAAAADNADALRKAAQNRQPDQRSSPGKLELQHRNERSHPECLERSACGSVQLVAKLELDRPLDRAHHLPTAGRIRTAATLWTRLRIQRQRNCRRRADKPRRLRIRRHAARVFLLSEKGQSDLGRRSTIPATHGDKDRHPGAGKIRHWADCSTLGATGQVDGGLAYK